MLKSYRINKCPYFISYYGDVTWCGHTQFYVELIYGGTHTYSNFI